jgi:hypothetical protein
MDNKHQSNFELKYMYVYVSERAVVFRTVSKPFCSGLVSDSTYEGM